MLLTLNFVIFKKHTIQIHLGKLLTYLLQLNVIGDLTVLVNSVMYVRSKHVNNITTTVLNFQ